MSTQEAVFYDPRSIALPRRILAHLAVGAARLLATQSPRRIRKLLGWLRRGAQPATFEQVKVARDTVVAVSLTCAAGCKGGCLPDRWPRSCSVGCAAGGRPGAWEHGGFHRSARTPG